MAACASPLLTLTALWQIKEWRFDRLREHLRSEGIVRQLWGLIRPALVALFVIPYALQSITVTTWIVATLSALAALNLVQVLLRKQSLPVWTRKAVLIVVLATGFDALMAAHAARTWPEILVLLALLQPAVLTIAVVLTLPLDRYLKQRVMEQAKQLRKAHTDCTVIGITGSVGKTTTKHLLQHLLKEKGAVCTPAYVNSEMGVARWLISVLKGKELPPILIVEMGAYREGEITKLCEIAQPTIGVVTFVGRQHVALFGSQEKLQNAKGELPAAIPENGHVFLNNDSSLCASLKDRCRCPVTTVGTGGHADLEAFDIEETADGIRFRVDGTMLSCSIHGTHNVTNALLAIAVARSLGMLDSTIATHLQSFEGQAHTFSVRTSHGVTILDDTHNASLASFEAAIAWTKAHPAKEKVLLTSGLMEMGAEQDSIHATLGKDSTEVFDRVIFLHKRNARQFQRGYGNDVEDFRSGMTHVPPGSLLVCIGRMPEFIIDSLLPDE